MKNVREVTEDLLLTIGGCNPSMKGFKLVVDAVEMLIEQPGLNYHLVDGLYKEIARKNLSNLTKVERAIRTLITRIYSNGDTDAIDNILGNIALMKTGKPTVGAFLSTLALKVKRLC